jgi:hypothetical protein
MKQVREMRGKIGMNQKSFKPVREEMMKSKKKSGQMEIEGGDENELNGSNRGTSSEIVRVLLNG